MQYSQRAASDCRKVRKKCKKKSEEYAIGRKRIHGKGITFDWMRQRAIKTSESAREWGKELTRRKAMVKRGKSTTPGYKGSSLYPVVHRYRRAWFISGCKNQWGKTGRFSFWNRSAVMLYALLYIVQDRIRQRGTARKKEEDNKKWMPHDLGPWADGRPEAIDDHSDVTSGWHKKDLAVHKKKSVAQFSFASLFYLFLLEHNDRLYVSCHILLSLISRYTNARKITSFRIIIQPCTCTCKLLHENPSFFF